MSKLFATASSLLAGSLLLFSVPVVKANPHHDACLKAADYEGCIKVMTYGVQSSETDSLTKLRSAMKQVASRLVSGTSLRDSSSVFQPVVDAHAVVPEEQQDTLAYQAASLAIDLFDDTQDIWQRRISGSIYMSSLGLIQLPKACELYQSMVRVAAARTGDPQAFSWSYQTKGLLGTTCKWSSAPETPVYRYTIGVLRDGSTDPKEIADYTAKLVEAKRLAALGPWQRYLDQNPGVAQWAKANPTLAEKRKAEYVQKYGSDPVEMPELPSTLSYVKGTYVEKYL